MAKFEDERKIEWKYDTDKFDCYIITATLSAWIAKDKTSLLFGANCTPDSQGLKDATLKGILLTEDDIEALLALVRDLSIYKAFEACKDKSVFFPLSRSITLRIATYRNAKYGSCITFTEGSRFACISQRRFKQFLELLDAGYAEATAPVFNLPDVFKN